MPEESDADFGYDDYEQLPRKIQEFRKRVVAKYGYTEEQGAIEQYPELAFDMTSDERDQNRQILVLYSSRGVPDEAATMARMREALGKVDEIAQVLNANFDPNHVIDRIAPHHLPTQPMPKDTLRSTTIYSWI